MNANFEKEVKMNQYIHQMYQNAKEVDDKEVMELAKTKYQTFKDDIMERGDDYVMVYQKVLNANERGNELIDIYDSIWESQLPTMLEAFRKFGIEQFTVSSTYSSMNETIWTLLQNGCELAGMVLVKSNTMETIFEKDNIHEERKDVPAFLIKIK